MFELIYCEEEKLRSQSTRPSESTSLATGYPVYLDNTPSRPRPPSLVTWAFYHQVNSSLLAWSTTYAALSWVLVSCLHLLMVSYSLVQEENTRLGSYHVRFGVGQYQPNYSSPMNTHKIPWRAVPCGYSWITCQQSLAAITGQSYQCLM